MTLAVRNVIQQNVINNILNKNSAECQITANGRPTVSYQGLVFFGVHGGYSVSNPESYGGYYLDETYFFKVTVSLKSGQIHGTRLGDVTINDPESGAQYCSDLLKSALHNNLTLWSDATLLMQDVYPNAQPFTSDAVQFLKTDESKEQTSSWFNSKTDDKGSIAGISLTSYYRGLRLFRNPATIYPGNS